MIEDIPGRQMLLPQRNSRFDSWRVNLMNLTLLSDWRYPGKTNVITAEKLKVLLIKAFSFIIPTTWGKRCKRQFLKIKEAHKWGGIWVLRVLELHTQSSGKINVHWVVVSFILWKSICIFGLLSSILRDGLHQFNYLGELFSRHLLEWIASDFSGKEIWEDCFMCGMIRCCSFGWYNLEQRITVIILKRSSKFDDNGVLLLCAPG